MSDQDIRTAAEAEEAAALPNRHEVHVDGEVQDGGIPEKLRKAARGKSPARWAYERLILYIQNFETQLDADQEVAMGFTGSDAGVIRIEGMGHFDPDIVTFYGTDPTGAKTQLVQHVSQLNVLLRALPKKTTEEAPTRIGFRLARALEEET